MSAQKKPRARPLVVFFALLGLIVAVLIAAGLLPRLSRQKGLAAAAQEVTARKPVVLVSPVHFAASKDTVDLPGDLVAMIESPIVSRADGYLKAKLVDLGWHVAAGQPMAEIETPELDQQISQARSAQAQAQATLKELAAEITLARANLDLAKVTAERWEKLEAQGVIARQDADAKRADFAVKQAQAQKADATLQTAQETVHASEASVRRLEQLKSFARVTAPFDGVVTGRYVDIGTLITAGSKEMFRVAKLQPLRIFVNVPQTYVESIHQNQTAELRVQERPGEIFPAHVSGISNSLDVGSRAMLVVLQTPNAASTLFPGMYAQVRFAAPQGRQALRIPGDALMLDKAGPRVAVTGADNVVHFRAVKIGQDLGTEVEVTSGVSLGEMVISNPSDVVQEGAKVDVRKR